MYEFWNNSSRSNKQYLCWISWIFPAFRQRTEYPLCFYLLHYVLN
jgi:hypothetical protein